MTTKPTIEAYITGTLHVVSTAEWNTNVLQEGLYVQEVLAGTNADKIPATALSAITASSVLLADTTISTTVGTDTDGPSLALPANGTWFVIATCMLTNQANASYDVRAKLQSSGGTIYDQQEITLPATTSTVSYGTSRIPLFAAAIPGGTTIKISGAQTTANIGSVMKATNTYIMAMRNGG